MQLRPLYDTPSFVQLEVPVDDLGLLVVRQRRRLARFLEALELPDTARATRCDGWTVKDVVAHLVSTNQFWAWSIGAALAGEPTRLLQSFDPVKSPAELVEPSRSLAWGDVLAQYVDTVERLAIVVERIDQSTAAMLGEAPQGHIPVSGVALHALWDAWVHERDIMLPLGAQPPEDPGEIVACLWYVAALGPAFAFAAGERRRGAVVVDARDPAVHGVVEVGDGVRVHTGRAPTGSLHLTGSAVELVEALSLRAPMHPQVDPEDRWLVAGVAIAFDQATT